MSEIDWALLARYAAGECSAEERASLQQRLDDEPGYRTALTTIGRVTAQARLSVPVEEQAERTAKLYATITGSRKTAVTPWQQRLPLLKVAAAIFLVLGGSVAGYAAFRGQATPVVASPTVHTITTPRGQRMSLRLADGTAVLLAPASTLRFAATYGARDRTVELDGEAAFTVTHDERRPFVVRAGELVAEDLGTRFVVRAYRDDPSAEVVVAEGEVAVTRGSAAHRVVLSRGDRARVTPDSGVALTHGVQLDSYFGWTEGRLVFRRTPLAEAVAQISRWHDVEIRLPAPDIRQRRFSAAFRQDQSVSQILGAVATALRLNVEQAGPRQYILRAE